MIHRVGQDLSLVVLCSKAAGQQCCPTIQLPGTSKNLFFPPETFPKILIHNEMDLYFLDYLEQKTTCLVSKQEGLKALNHSPE